MCFIINPKIYIVTIILSLLILLFIFTFKTIQYIINRYKNNEIFLELVDNNNDDDDDELDYSSIILNKNIQKWLNHNQSIVNNNNNNNDNVTDFCKSKIINIDIIVNKEKDNICSKLSKEFCQDETQLTKITVPEDNNIPFYLDSGTKLINGRSYCIYKPPPPLISNNTSKNITCHETWGFWQYSTKYECWLCKSKVPGVYNAEKNKFDACQPGYMTFNDKPISYETLIDQKTPEFFYNIENQKKFGCHCPHGYVFKPEVSRTTCFKDPCLSLLPKGVLSVKGYNPLTGECDCGDMFYNVNVKNKKSYCTACPSPIWDPSQNILRLFIKCGEKEMFPCVTQDEKIRGCKAETIIRMKQLTFNKDTTFENLIIF